MVKLIIARHCQTEGNAKGLFQGRSSTPISSRGHFELGLLSARLKDEKIDIIYTSPQDRAVATAEAVNEFHGVPIIKHDGLMEIFLGDLEETYINDFPENHKKRAMMWYSEPHNFESPNGETMRDVFERVSSTIDEIAKENDGKTVFVASHGCAIWNMMTYISGYPIEEMSNIKLGANTAVSIVEVDDEKFDIKLMGDCSHVPKLSEAASFTSKLNKAFESVLKDGDIVG